jgi:hypothetical protein
LQVEKDSASLGQAGALVVVGPNVFDPLLDGLLREAERA